MTSRPLQLLIGLVLGATFGMICLLPVQWSSNRDLIRAAAFGDTNGVSTAIAAGADIDARAYDGWTAMTIAAHNGQSDTVVRLLELGADPEILDGSRRSALSRAIEKCDMRAAERLGAYVVA